MGQAVLDCHAGVLLPVRPIHWLQQQTGGTQALERLWWGALLRVNKLQLITAGQLQTGTCLGTDTHPVQTYWCLPGAVRLNAHLKPCRVKRIDRGRVELE